MTPLRKVLVTGSGGLIGGALFRELGDRFEFTGLDVGTSDNPEVPITVGDLSNMESVRKAFDGVDCVIHLGADSNQNAPWESVLPNNLIATRNVFEACKDAGVKRVVYASSNHAVGMHELDDPYSRIRVGDYDALDPENIPQIDLSLIHI